jgi:hypothetical protein
LVPSEENQMIDRITSIVSAPPPMDRPRTVEVSRPLTRPPASQSLTIETPLVGAPGGVGIPTTPLPVSPAGV